MTGRPGEQLAINRLTLKGVPAETAAAIINDVYDIIGPAISHIVSQDGTLTVSLLVKQQPDQSAFISKTEIEALDPKEELRVEHRESGIYLSVGIPQEGKDA